LAITYGKYLAALVVECLLDVLSQAEAEVGPGPDRRSFCVFLSDPDPESKICEKRDSDAEPLFHCGSSTSLCGHF